MERKSVNAKGQLRIHCDFDGQIEESEKKNKKKTLKRIAKAIDSLRRVRTDFSKVPTKWTVHQSEWNWLTKKQKKRKFRAPATGLRLTDWHSEHKNRKLRENPSNRTSKCWVGAYVPCMRQSECLWVTHEPKHQHLPHCYIQQTIPWNSDFPHSLRLNTKKAQTNERTNEQQGKNPNWPEEIERWAIFLRLIFHQKIVIRFCIANNKMI